MILVWENYLNNVTLDSFVSPCRTHCILENLEKFGHLFKFMSDSRFKIDIVGIPLHSIPTYYTHSV